MHPSVEGMGYGEAAPHRARGKLPTVQVGLEPLAHTNKELVC